MNILAPPSADWRVPVTSISGATGGGLSELWDTVEEFRKVHSESGAWQKRRAEQRVAWFRARLDEELRRRVLGSRKARTGVAEAEAAVRAGERAPEAMADAVLDALGLPAGG